MKFTNQYIETTNNQVLRAVLENMKPQIADRIEATVKWLESEKNARPVSAYGKECIELGLIHDICKSIVSYTLTSDELVLFGVGTSIKGNFEMTGSILRNGEQFNFTTEAIIAGGAVQRDHYRYLTKTNLPKIGNMELAKEIKKSINLKNKQERKLQDIARLEGHVLRAQEKVNFMSTFTREDWINHINENDADSFITSDNWNEFDDNHKEQCFENSYAVYKQWILDTNEDTLQRAMKEVEHKENRIKYLKVEIKKEEARLTLM